MRKILFGILAGFLIFFVVIFTYSYMDGKFKNYNDITVEVNGIEVIPDYDHPSSSKHVHFNLEGLIDDLSKDATRLNSLVGPNDVMNTINWFHKSIWGFTGPGFIQKAISGEKIEAEDIGFGIANVLTAGLLEVGMMAVGLVSVIAVTGVFIIDTGASYFQIFTNVLDNGYLIYT